ncbi:bestrophin-2-like [Tubulanus polymorphus]|uniref:bestrophin-2-like n=1 Tax=Tubulanus polymorphus TaxID=672921 RepID=UPI003DA5E3C9
MTISYSHKVSKVRLCGFSRLLLYWRGSIYKLMYKEIMIFVTLYTALSALYRFGLENEHKRIFEKIVIYCEAFTNLIPLSFILGFYVSIIITRWWQQYQNIPWPDRASTCVGSLIHGTDDRGRMIRRTLMRYLNLASVFIFQSISTPVKKRFPTDDHIVRSGLMTESERKVYDAIPSPHSKFWVPCQWAASLASRARNEGRIKDDIHLKSILDEINSYRNHLGVLYGFDWVSVPLVYTQVATLSVYTFFTACLFGRQFLDPEQNYPGHRIDLYVPAFTIFQFFFYMGWIKVAEQLINPFGEDDDDFDINWIIDRNLQVGFLAVDEMYMDVPYLEPDRWWNDIDVDLPYTKSSIGFKTEPFMGSTADLGLPKEDMKFVNMETIHEISNHQLPSVIKSSPSLPLNTSSLNVTLTSPVKRKCYLHPLNTNLAVSTETIDFQKGYNRESNEIRPLISHISDKVNSATYVKEWISNHGTNEPMSTPASTRPNSLHPADHEMYHHVTTPYHDTVHPCAWTAEDDADKINENAELMKQWFHDRGSLESSEKSLDKLSEAGKTNSPIDRLTSTPIPTPAATTACKLARDLENCLACEDNAAYLPSSPETSIKAAPDRIYPDITISISDETKMKTVSTDGSTRELLT